MEQNQTPDFPWMPSTEESKQGKRQGERKGEGHYSVGALLAVFCVIIVFTVILTYTLTFASVRAEYGAALEQYGQKLAYSERELDNAKKALAHLQELLGSTGMGEFGKLDFLSMLFEESSYYIDSVSEEERLDAVLKAYAAATGDNYAEYYSNEEYAELLAASIGKQVGIGVSVLQTEITVEGRTYAVFQIIAIFKNAPAEGSGVRVGDYIYAVRENGSYQTIEALGGYTAALNLFRKEEGTEVSFAVFRPDGSGYTSHEISVMRGIFTSETVTYTKAESDPTIGIVRIFSFDLITPKQLKEAMNALIADGAEKFVLDVRNNPGGDLMSIKAVLSYFLKDGDLILSSIDKDGNDADSYYVEEMLLGGDYADCSVAQSEIGMYSDLDMVVICNGNTASAAEVFTATLRDYELATLVGETTFGKGVMQSIISLRAVSYGMYDGYVKMTTYAFVTKCGVSYHDFGITPSVEATLSEEAQKYSIYTLPQALDGQLQAALAQFDN